MLEYFQKLIARRDEENGASAVEYGLMVAAIAAVIVVAVFALGGMISGAFTNTCDAVSTGVTANGAADAEACE